MSTRTLCPDIKANGLLDSQGLALRLSGWEVDFLRSLSRAYNYVYIITHIIKPHFIDLTRVKSEICRNA